MYIGYCKSFSIHLSKVVIGHGIGGKCIPINMARLAESQSLE